nr:uncharacterized protein LOC119164186 [Rhipicephalus microplus]
MNSLLERLVNFLQRRLVPCATSVQEQDADGFYVRLSGDLEPEPLRQAPGRPTAAAGGHTARTAPPKPPRCRTVNPVQTAFPSNWSTTRGRPDYEPGAKRSSMVDGYAMEPTLAVQYRRSLKPSATRPPTPFVESTAAAQHMSPGRRCCEVRV